MENIGNIWKTLQDIDILWTFMIYYEIIMIIYDIFWYFMIFFIISIF